MLIPFTKGANLQEHIGRGDATKETLRPSGEKGKEEIRQKLRWSALPCLP